MDLVLGEIADKTLLGMVALAVRCARRIMPLIVTEADSPVIEIQDRSMFSAMVAIAEDFVRSGHWAVIEQEFSGLIQIPPGSSVDPRDIKDWMSKEAHAERACICTYQASLAAAQGNVMVTAQYASDAIRYASFAVYGFPHSGELDLVNYALETDALYLPAAENHWPDNERGTAINPGFMGPMGDIWSPIEDALWLRTAQGNSLFKVLPIALPKVPDPTALFADEEPISPLPPVTVYVDPGYAPQELITELFLALSAYHESLGGSGLQIIKEERRSLVGEEAAL